jgi:hypothetical protein
MGASCLSPGNNQVDFLRLLNPTNSNIVVSNIQNAVETGTEEIFTEKFSIFVPFAKLKNDSGEQNHIPYFERSRIFILIAKHFASILL